MATKLATVTTLLACSLPACTTNDDDPAVSDPQDISDLPELEGTWRERGYARVLDVTPDAVTEYHITDVSCVESETFDISDVQSAHDRIHGNEAAFSWYELGHFTRHEFDRIDAPPDDCKKAGVDLNAEANFEALWTLFHENYAYFAERGVDSPATYDDHRTRATASSTPEELFAIFQDMLVPLDDGHVFVWDGGSLGFLSGGMGNLWMEWAAQYEGEPVTNPIDPRRDFIVDMERHVKNKVLQGEGKTGLYNLIYWGWVAKGVGYVNVHEMASADAGELTTPTWRTRSTT